MRQIQALVLAGLLTLGASPSIAADDHKPMYDDQVRETKNYDMELVAKDRELILYLNEHGGKKFDAKAASATAIVLTGKEKATVKLAPAGDHVLKGAGTLCRSGHQGSCHGDLGWQVLGTGALHPNGQGFSR